MFIFLLFIALGVVWCLAKGKFIRTICAFWDRYKFSKTIPGPVFYEILNHATEEEALSWVVELSLQYGRVFRVWFAENVTVFVSDPDYLKVVLSSNELIEKSNDYKTVEPWLGRGLLTNGGPSWHQQRKLLTPAFHFNILGTFRAPMVECCTVLVDQLSAVADGKQTIDVYPYISMCSLDVICETAMGIKTNYQLKKDSEQVIATQRVCKYMIEQMFSVWQQIPMLFYFSSNRRMMEDALKVLHGQTKQVIQTRRSEMLAAGSEFESKSDTDDVGRKQRFAFLDSLLKAQMEGAQLTDKQIEDEVNTFMFEGHDTVSSAISFAIYALSQHEEFQRRARDEVLAANDLDATPFLEAFIKETLRLYPSVPYYSRNVVEPFQMGPHLIPSGVTIAILAYMVHRDPELYADPDTFNPDRFLNVVSPHPFGHVAFSAGPRNCIGQRFAILEMKCTLSSILRTFDVLPVQGFKLALSARLVLGCTNGVQVRLRKRERV